MVHHAHAMRRGVLWAALASSACVAACSGADGGASDSVERDAAPAGVPPDASVTIRAPTGADGGVELLDAALVDGAASDAMLPAAADGAPSDASPPPVDARAIDASPAPDASVAIDASPAPDASVAIDAAVVVPPGAGHALFRTMDGHWRRIAATAGATSVDVSAALDALSAGTDSSASLGLDGAWIALNTTRFGCSSGACLALANATGTQAALVMIGGAEVPIPARPAVAAGGNLVVYPATGGPHTNDLYATRRSGGVWSAPVLLTSKSRFPYAHDIGVAPDGSRVVFDCGQSPYQDAGGAICEAATDGSSFREVVVAAAIAGSTNANEVHHPAYAPDGSIVFEADWNGSEDVWRIAGGAPSRVSPADETDDNSPCVLPDGRVVSLWLGRLGNTGSVHEMKVMNADGTGTAMLVTGTDIVDVGTTCGR